MTHEEFTAAVLAAPHDTGLRLAWADWLEEQGDPRAEMLRLQHALTQPDDRVPHRDRLEARLLERLGDGVEHPGPFLVNSIGMELVYCPAGHFVMGSPPDEWDRRPDEDQVAVTLTRGFWLGRYPVTQAEYRQVMRTNPSGFQPAGARSAQVVGLVTTRFPVEQVTSDEAEMFGRRLTDRERADGVLPAAPAGCRYRLPTEAEWEYACRAGTRTPFSFGPACDGTQANCNGTSPYGGLGEGPYLDRPSEVGSYPANPWGLFDMHGNVWEWCRTWYTPRLPRGVDPTGPPSGSARVIRGGSWRVRPRFARSAHRVTFRPEDREDVVGFRLCLAAG